MKILECPDLAMAFPLFWKFGRTSPTELALEKYMALLFGEIMFGPFWSSFDRMSVDGQDRMVRHAR